MGLLRLSIRFAATLMMTIAALWIGFEVWLSVVATAGGSGVFAALLSTLMNVVFGAWPAFLLIFGAVALARIYRRIPDTDPAS